MTGSGKSGARRLGETLQVAGVVHQDEGKSAIFYVKDVHGAGILLQPPKVLVAQPQHRAEQHAVDDGVRDQGNHLLWVAGDNLVQASQAPARAR